MVKIFVSGFPLDIEEIELAKLFAVHGDISTLKIVRDKKTRVCKGYAFIEMPDRDEAERAAEALNGAPMRGKELTVKINEETAMPAEIMKTEKQADLPIPKKVYEGRKDQRLKRPRRSF